MGQVAHLVGDHCEAASGLAGARGFDGGVEGEQVGLLGDALDHFEDLADVHRTAVEGLDVGAGGADLLGKLVHRADGLLDHLLAVFGLVVGVGGVVRGIGGVAGDFLGGGAEFVDRCCDAVGAVGLLVGVGHRRVRGVHHQLRDVVQFVRGPGDFPDRAMDTLDELVEGIAEHAEFIAAGHGEALGQVALALGDVLHGTAHQVQRLHQQADQQAEQDQDGDDGDQRGGDGRDAELAEHGVGLVLVDGQRQVPGHRRQALDRGKGEDAGMPVQFGLAETGGDLRRVLRVDLAQGLHHLLFVRVHQDLAVAADQEGVAHAAEVQRIDDLHQGLQAEVAAYHAEGVASGLHRCRRGDDQFLGGGVDVGFGQGQAAGRHGVLVPGPAARIVAGRHRAVRTHGEDAVLLAEVGEAEGRGQGRLFEQGADGFRAVVAGQGLGGLLDQQQTAAEPVLNVAGSHVTHFPQVAFEVLADRVALQVIVVEGEQCEGGEHHEGGREEDLVAELQTFDHVVLRPGVCSASL
ncbi:hypothetical protein PAERUG_P54_1_London_24_VIM_2_04_13_04670 [Pseudomonas aeruginosa]|nr:hypothetical protein PAERUG_P54_1_London_24_VIM_2_04_13_04670 [Pseudomonas aeruginosa]